MKGALALAESVAGWLGSFWADTNWQMAKAATARNACFILLKSLIERIMLQK
jgi:hypothetical protein